MAQPVSLRDASAALRAAMRETIKKYSWLYLLQALVLVVAGLAALIYPLLTAAALVVFLGWVLIVAGIIQAVSLIGASRVPHFWLQLVSAVLSAIVGLLLVSNPDVGMGGLALLLIVYFMVEGISKVIFSLTVRPFPQWGWVLASGVLGIAISLILLMNPGMALWLFGLLIGIMLIGEGVALGYMAWSARTYRD